MVVLDNGKLYYLRWIFIAEGYKKQKHEWTKVILEIAKGNVQKSLKMFEKRTNWMNTKH